MYSRWILIGEFSQTKRRVFRVSRLSRSRRVPGIQELQMKPQMCRLIARRATCEGGTR